MFDHLPSSCPIVGPTTKVGQEAVRLHEEAARLRAAAEAIAREVDAIQRAPREIEAALEAEYRKAATAGKPSSAKADKLAKELVAARAKAEEPHEVRLRAAQQAASRARTAYLAFVRSHVPELVAELRPDAEAAHARLVAAMRELNAASEEWNNVASRSVNVIARHQALSGQDVPTNPARKLASEAARVIDRLPLPLPKDDAMSRLFGAHATADVQEAA